ncbi:MAG: lytic transglycosylase domain-containing protein [Magnetococcales bacterium]|nr:lytic transglycosylase domain-containing protein [Magnetococcales bacterium]MBF0152056.1 lytic transglycosylase domain-containing protein [Magnetococcales bacterium]MBF0172302.1 lytic transglycosylase domain-containing protein [Magnetococcales bacterium]MBF0630682.1 lytic transglycosylase domain-containing protein [Magnetococcales bacterium]
MFLVQGSAQGDIYTYVDARGVVHLTDRPTDPRYQLLMRTQPLEPRTDRKANAKNRYSYGYDYDSEKYDASLGNAFSSWGNSVEPYISIIRDAAKRTGINDALLKAVIRAESAFNPLAVSRKGAVGLMQLMPDTAKRYGVKNRLDPHANIHAGASFLRDLLFQFDNDLKLSLAAYNAGEGAVRKHGNIIPPYPETQRYVAKVLQFYKQYRYAM